MTGSAYAAFRSDLGQLDEIDWAAVEARDFRDADTKERKQAEFLVHEYFPWDLVERVGVRSQDIAVRVQQVIQEAAHQPTVAVMPGWYF